MSGSKGKDHRVSPEALRVTRRGSALVPIIAAMSILLVAGIALVEVFGAQQSQAVSAASSIRAYWIAEAGLWHAAHDASGVPSASPFAGGTYTVTKSGDDYRSTGSVNGVARSASRTITSDAGGGDGSDGGTGDPSPLDEAASAAGTRVRSNLSFDLPLVSIVPDALVIESFSLCASPDTVPLHRLRLDNTEIYHEHSGQPLPTDIISISDKSAKDRTIDAYDRPSLRIDLDDEASGFITFTLVLNFADGTTATIAPGVDFG